MPVLITPPELLKALHNAVKQPTTDELREQSVSYVMGIVGAESGITRSEVENVLSNQPSGTKTAA